MSFPRFIVPEAWTAEDMPEDTILFLPKVRPLSDETLLECYLAALREEPRRFGVIVGVGKE